MRADATTVEASRLATAEAAVAAWCDEADPAVLSGPAAADGAVRAAAMIRRLTAAQTSLAGRVEATRAFRGTHQDAAGWLAATSGTSVGEAHRMLKTGERLGSCPQVRVAFEHGELSLVEADLVTVAAVADPSAEASLVALATAKHNVRSLRERSDRVRRGVHDAREEAERAAAVRASRRWCESSDPVDGAPRVDAKFVPQDYAAAKEVLRVFQDRIFDAARRAGRHEPATAYAADAAIAAILAGGTTVGVALPANVSSVDLAAVTAGSTDPGDGDDGDPATISAAPTSARGKVGSGPPCVLVDAIALQRGHVAAGETCEIPGVGPVDLDWARQLMGDQLVDVIVHNGVDITTYASTTRYVPRPVQVAIDIRDRGCTVPDCHRTQRLERDHEIDFADTHDTSYRNIRRLCDDDHDAKTHRGARLERHHDHWWWYPPPDPGTTGDPNAPPPPVEPRRGPVGRHLTPWNLDHLPGEPEPPGRRPTGPSTSGC